MSAQDTLNVNSKFYDELLPAWNLITDILGGTRRMRAARVAYLPQHPAESDANYQIRLTTATFEPLFKVLSTNLTGRAFAMEMEIKNKPEDEALTKWLEDLDLQGNDVNSVGQEAFQILMEYGLVYLFADMHKSPAGLTKKEEEDSGVRPYLRLLKPTMVPMFRRDGKGVLQEVRLKETVNEWNGTEEVCKDRLRVLTPGQFVLYERTDDKTKTEEWIQVDKGPMTVGEIPVVAIYAQKGSCEPPLLEAAYLNIKYYQFESNHDNALTVAQFPMLTATGIDKANDTITIGPKKLVSSSNVNARFSYLEHSGVAIASGRTRLEDIKGSISALGMKLVMSQATGSTKTATENNQDDKQNISVLKFMAHRFADGFAQGLRLLGGWMGSTTINPDVSLKGAFQSDRTDPTELTALLGLKQAGDLSQETLWEEYKRRGVLSDDFNKDTEKERISLGGPVGLDETLSPTPPKKPAFGFGK